VGPSQCRWARARDTLAGHVVQRSSGRGRKRREARSRVHSVGWAEQFRCRSQARGARRRPRPIPTRTGFYTRTASLPFSPLPPSLLRPLSLHRRFPSPVLAISPPGTAKPPTTLAEPAPTPTARGAGERPPRRASAAAERCQIRDPAPFGRGLFFGDGAVAGCWSGGSGPDVRVIRGNSRELRGAPAALGGGGNGEFWCPVQPRPRAGSSG